MIILEHAYLSRNATIIPDFVGFLCRRDALNLDFRVATTCHRFPSGVRIQHNPPAKYFRVKMKKTGFGVSVQVPFAVGDSSVF
jgi:hypothetical protein